jgi:hypothetical protein
VQKRPPAESRRPAAISEAPYAGEDFHGEVTLAPIDAQIAAFHDAFHSAAMLLAFALLLGVWETIHESRSKRRHPEPNPSVG